MTNWGALIFDLAIIASATILAIYFNNGNWMWLLFAMILSGGYGKSKMILSGWIRKKQEEQ